jgi:predicted dehydrogenase
MGNHHTRLLAGMEGVKLVGVADPNPEVCAQVALRYGARAFADVDSLLEEADPDFASVAVPTREHYPVARILLERGIHVLVEKPIALTVEEGQSLIDLAGRHGPKLGVGHIERFNPAVTALKECLDAGQLGRAFQMSVRRIGGFPPRVSDVGVALDLATHDLDVFLYLTGAQVVRASAEVSWELNDQHEDLLCALLRFDSGVIGLLNINWLSPTKIRELMVHGERGMFKVDYLTQDLFFYENANHDGEWDSLQVFRGVAEGRMIRHPVTRREPLQVELEAFVRSIREDDPFPVSGEDALRALSLAHSLVQAGQQGKTLELAPGSG